MEVIQEIFKNGNVQWVLLGTLLLGLCSGVLGSFALLKKQSLIGDAMAHAALPGICLAFLIVGEKALIPFIIGATILGMIAAYCIQFIVRHSRIKEDTSIGLVLSVFFGIGIVLLTYIQHNGAGNQSGLDDFLFGQAASLVGADVQIISIISLLLLGVTALLFKELKVITFDPQFAKGLGLPVRGLNGLLMTMIVLAVVIGLQAVGVILMSALLITPAITARYWTDKLNVMTILSGIMGLISGGIGTIVSLSYASLPTGPVIILSLTVLFLFSLLFSPKRGLISTLIKRIRFNQNMLREDVLILFYEGEEWAKLQKKQDYSPYMSSSDLMNTRFISQRKLEQNLKKLRSERLLKKNSREEYRLTEEGLSVAHKLTLKRRLMEVYLMNEMHYGHLQLRTAHGEIRDIPKDILTELLDILKNQGRMPLLLKEQESELQETKPENVS
ncbi:iron chelate uptake ABC transporter family permease subunit [Priestia endophytica]|uniref:metal ABC transporter permease n=1 Tax=Priestia endophytica TaxID=135735 RepID=UPI000DCA5418|nr:metal ABC transporter permease [Priestia endophytica]RAS89124.1 manganese ABC transporter permease [Priestia endophytica]